MGLELPKTNGDSGDSDSNSDSENSSSSDSSGSDWECSSNKQSSARKPHFSVTSCDTGLKLKIAAIPPRKATPKRVGVKPSVKKKAVGESSQTVKSNKDRAALKKKGKSQLSDTTSSSESCKCSSDSSSDDDVPLKAVSKTLPPKSSLQKAGKNAKGESEEDMRSDKDCLSKTNNKDKPCVSKSNNTVKKTKSDDVNQDTIVKRGRGRPRIKAAVQEAATTAVEN